MKLSLQLLLVVGLMAHVAMSQRVLRKRQRRPMQISLTEEEFQCDGEVEFELITGFVYSSADDIIESNIGALQMSECLAQCRKSKSCHALNFETGLCVLFKSASGEDSEKLSASQFPVFTLYAQKVCLSANSGCNSPWAYETVPEVTLRSEMVTEKTTASSRNECAQFCMTHERFTCRSAAFDRDTQECLMAKYDRNMAGRTRSLIAINSTNDYMEMSCGAKPDRMCEFQKVQSKIMKTVDAVHLDTNSTEECRARCLASEFDCYSYDFMSAGEPICRLSHHSTATLAHIREPYLIIENATTYELQACYKVAIECKANEMVAQIQTSTVFNGKVYARTRPNSCVKDIHNETDFSITLPYNSVDCDVQRYNLSNFAASIVVQHHDMIVTQADVGLALHCKYELKNQVVTNSLLAGGEIGVRVDENLDTEYIKEVIVDSPDVTMRVTDYNGDDIFAAQVGDELALRFEIADRNSPYEIFVRELVALDGRDSSEIVLIDEEGCPTDSSIMQSVIQVGEGGKVLHAPFQAFKFPATEVVQFRALVTPCHPTCEPVECSTNSLDSSSATISYGKRRRKREVQENDIMVAQSIHITDKFLFNDNEADVEKLFTDGDCSNTYTGLIIAGILFIVAQIAILTAWSYQWHKKRATKEISPHHHHGYPMPHHGYRGRSSTASSTSTYLQ